MSKALFSFFDILMMEEVGRIVGEARKTGAAISISSVLAQVEEAYPDIGIAEEEIVHEIVTAAAAAGIAVDSRSAERKSA